MTRPAPMAACLLLLRTFDKDNPTPQQAIAAASDAVQTVLGDGPMADVNDGQLAAMIDFYLWKGATAFEVSAVAEWVRNGNFARPPATLATYGARGMAERDVWNVGNST